MALLNEKTRLPVEQKEVSSCRTRGDALLLGRGNCPPAEQGEMSFVERDTLRHVQQGDIGAASYPLLAHFRTSVGPISHLCL
jgi:hypothetical protein